MENENVEVTGMDEDYVEQIRQLKENTVSKADYDKLKAENKKILDAYVNGQQIEGVAATAAEKPDINKLKETLANDDLSNLDYCKTALELRETVIAEGGRDPFLPWGQNIAPTAEDVAAADRVAAALKSCIEYAEGDSEVFTNELQRITIEAMPKAGRR